MEVKYSFANGEVVKAEIDGQWALIWADILEEFDRLEHNNDQNERRRHTSLEAFNLDETLFPSNVDVEDEVICNAEYAELHNALNQLLPQQKELVKKVFFEQRTIASIARQEGVNEAAIRNRLKKIIRKLKKI